MKRTFLSLVLVLIAFAGFSQPNLLRITGQLTDDSTGAPLPYHPVLITGDSASGTCPSGMIYSQVVMTNANGFYLKNIPLWTTSPSNFIVSTKDCNNNVHSSIVPAVVGIDTVNFSICGGIMPPPPPSSTCQANFIFNPFSNVPGKMKFISKSTPLIALHSWDFGDGTTSNLKHPLHTFAAPGAYNVCLIIHQNNTTCADTFCTVVLVDSMNLPPPVPCNANFTTKLFPHMPGKVKFISQSTPLSALHTWDFGDGTTSSLKHPFHNYTNPGTYSVCLVVSQANCADTFCMNVLVDTMIAPPPVPCDASFNVKQFPFMPGKVKFISTSKPFKAQHHWDFGDGSTSTLRHPMHLYTTPGTYNVCLTVSDSIGQCADTFCLNVLVDTFNAPAPVICQANFNYYIDSITGAVHFLDQSSPAYHISNWDFGDNSVSTLKNPIHSYVNPGSYTVTLIISCLNPSNLCVDTISQVVVIPVSKTTQSSTSNLGFIGQIYPNPTSGDAKIDMEVNQAGKVHLQIMDLSGKKVYEYTGILESGYHSLSIPAGKLASGYYTLSLRHENGDSIVRKLSKIE